MLLASLIFFLASWSPYATLSFLTMVHGRHISTEKVNLCIEVLGKSSIIFNPIVYIAMSPGFRKTVIKLTRFQRNQIVPEQAAHIEEAPNNSKAFMIMLPNLPPCISRRRNGFTVAGLPCKATNDVYILEARPDSMQAIDV